MPSSYTLGTHFEKFIREQIERGAYTSASEVLRSALRLLEEQEERRRASLHALGGELDKGRKSGRAKPAGEVLDRLEGKYTRMAKIA